jgi:hypothetical protein
MSKQSRRPKQECAPDTCGGKVAVPSEKEVEALRALKAIKERVRAVKTHLKRLGDSRDDETVQKKKDLEKKLERLKEDWRRWEEKRGKAARERMILLGHESSDADEIP